MHSKGLIFYYIYLYIDLYIYMSLIMRKSTFWFPTWSKTRQYSYRRWLEARNFGFRKYRECIISVAKTKALISFTVTVKLICVFVFAYAYCWFFHDGAHIYKLGVIFSHCQIILGLKLCLKVGSFCSIFFYNYIMDLIIHTREKLPRFLRVLYSTIIQGFC